MLATEKVGERDSGTILRLNPATNTDKQPASLVEAIGDFSPFIVRSSADSPEQVERKIAYLLKQARLIDRLMSNNPIKDRRSVFYTALFVEREARENQATELGLEEICRVTLEMSDELNEEYDRYQQAKDRFQWLPGVDELTPEERADLLSSPELAKEVKMSDLSLRTHIMAGNLDAWVMKSGRVFSTLASFHRFKKLYLKEKKK